MEENGEECKVKNKIKKKFDFDTFYDQIRADNPILEANKSFWTRKGNSQKYTCTLCNIGVQVSTNLSASKTAILAHLEDKFHKKKYDSFVARESAVAHTTEVSATNRKNEEYVDATEDDVALKNVICAKPLKTKSHPATSRPFGKKGVNEEDDFRVPTNGKTKHANHVYSDTYIKKFLKDHWFWQKRGNILTCSLCHVNVTFSSETEFIMETSAHMASEPHKKAFSSLEDSLKTRSSDLHGDNKTFKTSLTSAEKEAEDIKQKSRNLNLEISGVHVTGDENVYHILKFVARALNVEFVRDSFSLAYRLPGPKDKSFNPPIICQFVSDTTRTEWLNAAKQKKLQSTDLNKSFPPSPVYIREDLTPLNKHIFHYARSLVKDGLLAFAWSKDGQILIRKTADSKVKRVWCTGDIDDVAHPHQPTVGKTKTKTLKNREP